jgi:hypothetical protein
VQGISGLGGVCIRGGKGMRIEKYSDRYWAVYDEDVLVCVCVYKKGAVEVVKRLTQGGVK